MVSSSSIMGIAALAAAVFVEAQSTSVAVTPSPIFSTITTTRPKSTSKTTSKTTKAQATAADVAAATHTVAVGASGFQFSPSKVTANVGDTIEWIFYPDGHSVIRAEYGFPCTPYEYIDIGRQGFYSGPEPVKAITNDMPRFRVRVNDTDPIFFYCGAPGSCYKEKMIGVINENSTATLDGQLDAALPLTTQILPGEPFPTESDGSGSDGQVINNYHHSLSGGAIAGVVIGCLAFILLGGVLVYLCGRRGGLNRAYRRASMHPQGPSAAQAPPVTEINYTAQPKNPAAQGWRNSHYSQFSNAYADQHTPLGQFSPPVSPQPTGYMRHSYYDHRVSSIAPSIAVEAPNNEAVPPPAPEAPPVELPASEDPGHGALPAYKPRSSFVGQETDYRPNKE